MRILLVEDDTDLADLVALGLRNEAYAVDVARSYAAAEETLTTTDFDVACIDLGLPDGDGRDLIERLGRDDHLRRPGRILVLTARDGVVDRVAGLDAGADDYLVKPFDFSELLARVRALVREYALLRYFLHHPGEVLSAERLLEHLWDANADPFTASVRVILSRLRRKLGEPSPIVTVTNAGYQLRGTW